MEPKPLEITRPEQPSSMMQKHVSNKTPTLTTVVKNLSDLSFNLNNHTKRHLQSSEQHKIPQEGIETLKEKQGRDEQYDISTLIETVLANLSVLKNAYPTHKKQFNTLKREFRKFQKECSRKPIAKEDVLLSQRLAREATLLVEKASRTTLETTSTSSISIKRKTEESRTSDLLVESSEPSAKKKKLLDKTKSLNESESTTSSTPEKMEYAEEEKASGKRVHEAYEDKRTRKCLKAAAILKQVPQEISVLSGLSAQRLSARSTHQIIMNRRRAVKKASPQIARVDAVSATIVALPVKASPFEILMSHSFPPVTEKILYHVAGDPIGAKDKSLTGADQIEGWSWLASAMEALSTVGDVDFQQKIATQQKMLLQGIQLERSISRLPKATMPQIVQRLRTSLEGLERGILTDPSWGMGRHEWPCHGI